MSRAVAVVSPGLAPPGRVMSGRRATRQAPLSVPTRRRHQPLGVPDADRSRGIHIVAGSGSGKSLMMGSILAFFDFLRGVPQVLFDPHGPMIDAFLLRLAQMPRWQRRRLWPRVLYADMSGRGERSVPLPLLYELGGESRQDIAARFLATCLAIDPQLETAPLLGANALAHIGQPVGVILSSLGLQLDAALSLLRDPGAWQGRIEEAVQRYPEAAPAAEFFRREYLLAGASERAMMSSAYRAKVEPVVTDPVMRDMFCRAPAGLVWEDVIAGRKTVLLDFRGETNGAKRLFKTRAVYDYLLAFIAHRGPGAHRPLALHIDEITELTNQSSAGNDLFARDLDEAIQVYARNYSVWLAIAHQEMNQVSVATQKTLLSMGTQIMGVTSDWQTAEYLARQFAPLDTGRVKRFENVWASESEPTWWGEHTTRHFVIDERVVDSPLEEQIYDASRVFMGLRPFEFLVKPKGSQDLVKISTARYVGDPWPTDHPEVLTHIRRQLARRAGAPRDVLPTAGGASDILGRLNTNHDVIEDSLDQIDWETGPLPSAAAGRSYR